MGKLNNSNSERNKLKQEIMKAVKRQRNGEQKESSPLVKTFTEKKLLAKSQDKA